MGFRGVWLTSGTPVIRRFRVGMRHDLHKDSPNFTRSTV